MTQEEKRTKRLERIKERVVNATNSDKQRAITYLCYIGIIAVSVLSSCLSVIFGLENFDSTRFITNLSFNIAIAILALILSWKDGELSNETRKRGPLYEIRQTFKKIVKLIVDTDSFRQWSDLLFERERKEYVISQLSNCQIYDYEYLLVSDAELEQLRHEPLDAIKVREKNGVVYEVALDQITEVQYYHILKFREGKYRFEKLPYTFFKTRLGGNLYKKYADTQDNERKVKMWAIFYRVLVVVVFSTIIALSIINPNKNSAQQVLLDTVSRLVNLIMSLFMGYSLAHDEANNEIQMLEYKCDVIQQYDDELQTGLFVPKNRNEIIMEKIKSLRAKKLGIETEPLEIVNEPVEETTEPQEEIIEIEMTQEEFDAMKKESE